MVDPTQNPDSTSNGTGNTPDSQDTAPVATVMEVRKHPRKNQTSPKKTKKHESSCSDSSSSSSEDKSSGSSSDESADESTSPPETVSSDTIDSESEEEQRRTKSTRKRSRRRDQKTKKIRTHRSTGSTTESDRSDNGPDSSKDSPQPPGPQPGILSGTQGAESADLILALAKRLTAMEAELNEARRSQNLVQCNHTTDQKEAPEDEPKKSKKDKIKIGTKVEFKRVDQCVLHSAIFYIPRY